MVLACINRWCGIVVVNNSRVGMFVLFWDRTYVAVRALLCHALRAEACICSRCFAILCEDISQPEQVNNGDGCDRLDKPHSNSISFDYSIKYRV